MNNKKKILFIISKFNNLGATKNTIDIINFIDKKKFTIKIIFIDYEVLFIKNNSIFKSIIKHNIDFIILNKIFPATNKFFFKINKILSKKFEKYISKIKLYFFFKNYNPDFIYSNRPLFDKGYFFQYIKIEKIIFHLSLVPSIIKNNFKHYDVKLINSSKKLLANNNHNRLLYQDKGINEKIIDILPLAIDINKISNNQSVQNKIISKIKENYKYIIAAIGPVSLRKGTDKFIELAKLCSNDKKFNNIHFLWIGYTKDSDKILFNNILPNNLTIAPHTDDIYSFSKFIDCLVVCSRSEGGPIVIIESMYLSKFNISYKNCGISNELLENNCGILLKDNNPIKYKNAINDLFIEQKIFINKEIAKQKVIKKYNIVESVIKLQKEFV
tara:strand:+ start:4458 stop:5612 length:1155 start_codon:yes stop_codon:yes gene_type:complete